MLHKLTNSDMMPVEVYVHIPLQLEIGLGSYISTNGSSHREDRQIQYRAIPHCGGRLGVVQITRHPNGGCPCICEARWGLTHCLAQADLELRVFRDDMASHLWHWVRDREVMEQRKFDGHPNGRNKGTRWTSLVGCNFRGTVLSLS